MIYSSLDPEFEFRGGLHDHLSVSLEDTERARNVQPNLYGNPLRQGLVVASDWCDARMYLTANRARLRDRGRLIPDPDFAHR
jgi:hypothetical protein